MSEVFLKIVNMSISASYLVLAVLLLRLVMKKAPKWVSVLLWGMVAVRLIIPISIESALSLIPSAEPVPVQVITELQVVVQPGTTQADTPVSDRTDTPGLDGTGGQSAADMPEPDAQSVPMVTVLAAAWATGVAGMLVYTAVSYFLLRRRVATAIRLRGNIYRSEHVDSPFVLGILAPRIYLPFKMDSRDLAHVIAHEEAHIRRKDHWWKPIGFVLLAIHWFNPLLWVGYILLCRDIELACDEKVIKEMDNETKATYSEALVACSVNRRRIAACPLAFGEVGVKERVKTVMNYKKPAFWIVIAAIALCIVVAVCFLTNPKENGYGPEVGNPKMLELPGVEWFVTPEELKEALNITEDQILGEKTQPTRENVATNYDRYWLYVTDITLYGRDVTYAQFEFRRDPGHDFEFFQVFVTFADDTDMDALKADLTDIYGLGSSEPYSYYLVEDDRTREYSAKMNLEQQMEYLAHTYKSEDGNPYMEALEDPEYMIHHWVTENGCDLIPEEVVEWFKYVMDRPWNADKTALQDDKVLMDMLDQFPWVAMTLSNRNAAAIRRDAEGYESEITPYYSNNYLEISASMLANYLHKEDQMSDPSLLEFPGLEWNMTPEEVKKNLALTADQILVDTQGQSSELMDTWVLTVTEVPFFGEEVAQAQFQFVKYAGYDKYGLDSVRIYYPDEVDMAEVRDTLIGIYGEGNSIGITRYRISNGKVHSSVDDKLHAISIPDALLYCWESSSKGTDVLSKEVQEEIIAIYTDPDFDNFADRDVVLEYLEKSPLVTLYCTDGAGEGNLSADDLYTCNHVNFSASAYINYVQKYDK